MSNLNIVYYYVPKKYTNLDQSQAQFYTINLNDWEEIIITDSHLNSKQKVAINGLTLPLSAFIDRPQDTATFLWNIKKKNEILFIEKKDKLKDQYLPERIESIEYLINERNNQFNEDYDSIFIYRRQDKISKIVYLYGREEALYLFVRNEFLQETEEVISKFADKVSFYQYEFEEDNDN